MEIQPEPPCARTGSGRLALAPYVASTATCVCAYQRDITQTLVARTGTRIPASPVIPPGHTDSSTGLRP